MIILAAAVAALLAGCATGARQSPEPVIVTKTEARPVPVSCVPKTLSPAPSYPDTDDELRSAGPERFLQLLIAGREQRAARSGEVEPVIEGCR
jgi:hypothetical protein